MWQVIFFSMLLKRTVVKQFNSLKEAKAFREEIGKGIVLNSNCEEVQSAN